MSQRVEERPKTKFEVLVDFVKARFLSIVFVLAALVVIAILLGFSIEIPRWLRLGGVVFVLLSPLGYIVGSYVTGLLWDPNNIYLIDLDARVIGGALFRFPADHFRELTVVDGEGRERRDYEMTELTPNLYTGKDVDLDAETVEGTWRGTLEDKELLRALTKVEECRSILEEDAKRGFAIEVMSFSIVRTAAQDVVRHVVDTFRKGTLPDGGDGINDAIDDALERWNVEEDLGDLDEYDLDELKAAAENAGVPDSPDAEPSEALDMAVGDADD